MARPDVQHPILSMFPPWRGIADGVSHYDFLGVITNPKMSQGLAAKPSGPIRTGYTKPGEQYFEWVTVLDAVLNARSEFTMMELGAGRGSWMVRAAYALRSSSNIPFHFTGVEGSKQRFEWMHEHFRDNGIDPADHRLLNAVVTKIDGHAYFLESDDPAFAGYGDSVVGGEEDFSRLKTQFGFEVSDMETGVKVETNRKGLYCLKLNSVSLNTLLAPLGKVDLIHMDVQGQEHDVLSNAIDQVAKKVAMLFVGIHSDDLQQRVRTLMLDSGFLPRYDFGRRSSWATEWGDIQFRDGCQVWLNRNQ